MPPEAPQGPQGEESPVGATRTSSTASIFLLNLIFWTAVPLVTLVFLLIGAPYVLIYGVVVHNHRRTFRLIRRSISRYGTVVLRCAWPFVHIRYVDHAPDEKPPFVFVANHRSASDAFLMAFLPFECIQVLNIWPSRIPVVGHIAALAGYLRVREMPFERFRELGTRRLREGVSIIAFPEGTRSGSRRMGPFHGSALRLAQGNRVKIVPLAITGNEEIPRRGSFVLRPGNIIVAKLPAVCPEEYAGMSPYKLKTRVRERIRQYLESRSA